MWPWGEPSRSWASAIRLNESITDAAPDKRKSKGLGPVPVKSTYSTCKNLEETKITYNNQRKYIKRRI